MDLRSTSVLGRIARPSNGSARRTGIFLPGRTAILVLAIAYQLASADLGARARGPAARPTAFGLRRRDRARDPGGRRRGSDSFASLRRSRQGAPAPVAENVTDAPDTTLSLDLRGILSTGSDGANGQAIIAANRGEDKAYHVGQSIDNASGTKLYSVYWDRVLLDRGDGRVETLRLPKELLGSPAARARGPVLAPPVAAPAANDSLRTVISQNASRFSDIVRIMPQVEQGKTVGFRVQPAGSPDVRRARSRARRRRHADQRRRARRREQRPAGLRGSRRGNAGKRDRASRRRSAVLVIDTTQLQGLKDKENRQ